MSGTRRLVTWVLVLTVLRVHHGGALNKRVHVRFRPPARNVTTPEGEVRDVITAFTAHPREKHMTCYHCTYSSPEVDRQCIKYPERVKGINKVPCYLEYCTSIIQIDSATGAVKSASRNCDASARGNYCKDDGVYTTCATTCRTNFCNGGSGIHDDDVTDDDNPCNRFGDRKIRAKCNKNQEDKRLIEARIRKNKIERCERFNNSKIVEKCLRNVYSRDDKLYNLGRGQGTRPSIVIGWSIVAVSAYYLAV